MAVLYHFLPKLGEKFFLFFSKADTAVALVFTLYDGS